MSRNTIPKILVIDDRETDFASKQYLKSKKLARINTLHPSDVDLRDLLDANLVLVDFQLDSWPDRDKLEWLALKPADGLALAAVLRRQVESQPNASPTAFAIYTGKLRELAGPLPPENRNHALARINNLEWVFEKGKDISGRLVSLARAVEKLPKSWSISGRLPREWLAELLNIKTSRPDTEQLLQDVETCLPPIHELSQWSHGLIIVRWLLHRILPYPCFLWDSHHLAARLRMEHRTVITNKHLQQKLRSCKYNGILAEFLGTRWWRSKVELLLWQATKGKSSDVKEVQKAVSRFAKIHTDADSLPTHPIVCINSDYQPLEKFFSSEDAVRVQPDDWPAYADQAWTTIELANTNDRLGALVVREDRAKLKKTSH
jgi:hypothetical protein